jgi:hypothetical protein
MSEVLDALFRSDGAMGVLRAFGLNRLLTDQDDPALWAAALMRHWHAPQEPELHLAALRFGVSRTVPASLSGTVKPGRSGMQQLEVWCFERVEAGRLRPLACPEQPGLSFMGALMGGGPGAAAQIASWVQDVLEVSRPSLGERTALVYAGMSAPVNAGSGETRLWARTADGNWTETDEIISHWLA